MAKKEKKSKSGAANKQAFADWANANRNILFLAGMGALLAGRVFLQGTDSVSLPPPAPPAVIDLTFPLNDGNLTVKSVEAVIDEMDPFSQSPYYQLVRENIFDPKLARSAEETVRQTNELYNQAFRDYNGGITARNRNDAAEARRFFGQSLNTVNQVLGIQPNHANARDLKTRLETELTRLDQAAAATPDPTPDAQP